MTTTQLCELIKSRDIFKVFYFLDKMDLEAVNGTDEFGCSPLHHACLYKNHLVVNKLVDTAGVKVNVADPLGYTPLHYACFQNNPQVLVNFLDTPGVDLNATNKWGLTPLLQACLYKNYEAVSLLVGTKGVNVNSCDPKGLTALHHACRINNLEMVIKLVNAPGIDVNVTDERGLTPLHFALDNFTENRKKCGSPALYHSCHCRNFEAETVNMLHQTCRINNLQIVSELVNCPGISVNTADKWGCTPLHYACRSRNHAAVVKLLDVSGVDVNLRDKDGMTPVMRAAKVNDKEILELLLNDQRVDMNLKNGEGEGLEELVGEKVEFLEKLGKYLDWNDSGIGRGSFGSFLTIKKARRRRLNEEAELKQESLSDGKILVKQGKNVTGANVGNVHLQRINNVNKRIEDTKKASCRNQQIKEKKMKNLIGKQDIEKEILKQKKSVSFKQIIKEVKRHSQDKVALEKKYEESPEALI